MENGVGIVDGSHLGEKKGVEDEVLELRAEEKAVIGSDGSKDSEEDEVFEEAVEAETPTVDSEELAVTKGGNVEKTGNLGGSLEVDEKLDVAHETEKFEEAIGVPTEIHNPEEAAPVVIGEKGGGSIGLEPVDEAPVKGMEEERSPSEEVVRDLLSGLENDKNESDVGAADKIQTLEDRDEVYENSGLVLERLELGVSNNVNLEGLLVGENKSDVGATGKIEALEDRDEVYENSSLVLEKLEHGVSNNVNLEGPLVSENSDDGDVDKQEMLVEDKLETRDANKVKGGDTDSQQNVESSGEILHLAEKNVEVNPASGILESEHQNDKSGELEDASAGLYSEHQVDNIEELKDDVVDLNTEELKDESKQLKDEAWARPNAGHQDDNGEEQQDISVNMDLKDQVDRNRELNDTSDIIELENCGGNCKQEDNLHTSVEERRVSTEVPSEPSLGNAIEKDEKNQTPTADLGAENSKGPQSQLAVSNVAVSNGEAEEPEKKGAKDEGMKQSPPENREQEIRPVAGVPSFPRRSSNSASTPARPAGLGRAAPLLEPAPRIVQQHQVNGSASSLQNQLIEDPTNGEAEENDETREKLQMIRVKFLRLAHRLGQTPHNVVVAQVLYRLGLAEQLRGRNGGRVAAFSFDRASSMAEQLEAAGQEPLDFSCTIMVLGKTGVGKSSTINSIFDEVKFGTDAFQVGTKKVQDVVGTVQGIKVRVIDTPGLLPSWSDQRQNEKILLSVKRFIKKTPPDIVLYLDRLDMQSRDFGDMPLLRTITEIFGPSIWFNAIVVLTHAAVAPPEGPNGTATSYDMFVTQRSHVVQQAIRQAAGDMRLMNPVSLVENHSACRTNRAGQRVLPNGQVWKPHLLLLSFASKILAEANTLLKLQDSPPGKPFSNRVRAPPLPFLLSSLLQSRPQVKLPAEQFGDDDDTLDDDLDESSESDDESEYDELPPFKRLTKAQLAKLTKSQRKAYYDELEYREKLYMKKQLKEEKKRRKMMKKMAASAKDLPSEYSDNVEEESGGAASVPVPMPDLALPVSFDSDYPTHRYRCLDSLNQWLVRPVLEPHGWDHDVGYEGINVERLFVVKDKIPVSFSGQVTKDKKDTNLQMEMASSVKHGKEKATSLGFDMQTIGKEIAYTFRCETMFSNYRQNKAMAGLSVTLLGDCLTGGVKVEDKLMVTKRGRLVVSGGAIFGRGDAAYGGSLEATLRDKDHPLGRFLTTVGLSVMDWHGDLAIGCNAQTQIPVGRFTNLIGRVNFNNRGSGQVSVRLNSSEQLQIALVGLIPLLRKLLGYSQAVQFGQ
ncbi:unnamed protein product [Ilex paraguariensis]|uniref:AIG1-type G domain-containing protein n=1 Tax=Ilex paraguariensis TaxID=185542 RepID=A0ABC8SY04_9AQUA